MLSYLQTIPRFILVLKRLARPSTELTRILKDIICKYQSGFRAIRSTVTALLEATDTWAYNIDRGKIKAVVCLDLKTAFDTVDHETLFISKLNLYGINGIAHQWFQSYLEDHTQMYVFHEWSPL